MSENKTQETKQPSKKLKRRKMKKANIKVATTSQKLEGRASQRSSVTPFDILHPPKTPNKNKQQSH